MVGNYCPLPPAPSCTAAEDIPLPLHYCLTVLHPCPSISFSHLRTLHRLPSTAADQTSARPTVATDHHPASAVISQGLRAHAPARAISRPTSNRTPPHTVLRSSHERLCLSRAAWPRSAEWKSCAYQTTSPNKHPGPEVDLGEAIFGRTCQDGNHCSIRGCTSRASLAKWRDQEGFSLQDSRGAHRHEREGAVDGLAFGPATIRLIHVHAQCKSSPAQIRQHQHRLDPGELRRSRLQHLRRRRRRLTTRLFRLEHA